MERGYKRYSDKFEISTTSTIYVKYNEIADDSTMKKQMRSF